MTACLFKQLSLVGDRTRVRVAAESYNLNKDGFKDGILRTGQNGSHPGLYRQPGCGGVDGWAGPDDMTTREGWPREGVCPSKSVEWKKQNKGCGCARSGRGCHGKDPQS